jgi:alkylation response protein AidB-like acyl-CoA dehydrogenase
VKFDARMLTEALDCWRPSDQDICVSCLEGQVSIILLYFLRKDLELINCRLLPEILTGEKRICLAITEPSAGSDVKGITTTAEKTADGKHYIVNGEKKISLTMALIKARN